MLNPTSNLDIEKTVSNKKYPGLLGSCRLELNLSDLPSKIDPPVKFGLLSFDHYNSIIYLITE